MCGNRHAGYYDFFKENNMLEDLYGEKENSTLKNKRLELAPNKIYGQRKKIKENMNKIYEIVFGKCTPSCQSVLKVFHHYDKKSKYCNCLWIMEQLKKISSGVYINANSRMLLIEQLI